MVDSSMAAFAFDRYNDLSSSLSSSNSNSTTSSPSSPRQAQIDIDWIKIANNIATPRGRPESINSLKDYPASRYSYYNND